MFFWMIVSGPAMATVIFKVLHKKSAKAKIYDISVSGEEGRWGHNSK